MVDGLFLVAADGVDQLNQLAVEHRGGVTDQLVLSLFARGRCRFSAIFDRLDLAGPGFNAIGVDGGQQIADDLGELYAARLLPDAFPSCAKTRPF